MLGQISDLFSTLLGKDKKAISTGPVVTLACDLGHSKVILLELEKNQGKAKIIRFAKLSRPKKIADGLKESIEKAGFQSTNVRISIKGQGVIVRFIQFPKMGGEELKGAMLYEAEKYIPFKASEVIVDHYILDEAAEGSDGKMMNLLLVAVKKEEIYSLIQSYQEAGLMVDLIDIDALTYVNALEYINPEIMETTVGILDIGTEISTLSVIQKGKPRFIRDISFGSVDIIKRLKRKLNLVEDSAVRILESIEEPGEETSAVLSEAIEQLVSDVKVSLDYYMDQVTPAEPITKLFVGGGRGNHALIRKTLSEGLELTVDLVDVLSKVELGEGVDAEEIKKNQGLLPVAFGLALRDQ